MKKLIALLLVCVIGVTFTSCIAFKDKIQYLGVVTLTDYSYIDVQQLKSANAEYETEYINSNESKITNDLLSLMEKQPFAVVIIGDILQKAVIDTLKIYNIPVIFIGSTPEREALDQYDKAWYLTANENQGGEMLGFEIGNAFKNDTIPDQNGDDILQCAMVYTAKSSSLNSITQSAEDLGVYSEIEEIEVTDIALLNDIVFEKYNNAIAPELVICETEELALAVQQAFVMINQPINVTLVHKNHTELKIASPPLFYASQYPFNDVTSACQQFINNLLIKETINHNTDIRLDSHKISVFSYILTN